MSTALPIWTPPPGLVLVGLDFETHYSTDYQIKKMTTESYVRDPRFEVIGVGVKVGSAETVWLEEWEFRAWAQRVDWSRVALIAHHTQFDAFILSERYDVHPAFLICTMSMGRAICDEGALETLAERFKVGVKGGELANTKGKRRRDFTQIQWGAFGVYCRNDVELSVRLFELWRSTFPAAELSVIDATVRCFTEPVFLGDRAVLDQALAAEKASKAELLKRVEELTGLNGKEVLSSSDKFAALLRTLEVEPPTKLDDKGVKIYAFAKTDPGMTDLLEHWRDDVRQLAEARLSVKSTIVESRVERLIGIANRGRVPFYLKYAGAHTHRWSGGDKMNPQNFNRGGALRAAILAPPGHTLVVCDSSQIEARVLPWLAGESTLVDLFRANDAESTEGEMKAAAQGVSLKKYWEQNGGEPDFYSAVGSTFFLKRISKAETPVERQLSKNMILGLGFGMGWTKFAGELLKGMLGSKPVQFGSAEVSKFNVDVQEFAGRRRGDGTNADVVREMKTRLEFDPLLIHCAVADHFVRLYRGTNSRISGLWRTCESLIKQMTQFEETQFGCLRVIRHGIVKPNGLVLRYPGLRSQKGRWVYQDGHEVKDIYGGLLTENLVQSLARDIVAEQLLRVRGCGYHVATTTHDEIVAVVPEAEGPTAYQRMRACMRIAPAWCRDLPLNANGGFGRSYGAVK